MTKDNKRSFALTDKEKKDIITKAILLVNENYKNFKRNVRRDGISSSNLRNILNSTTGLPLEFYVFCQYLAGKNPKNHSLIAFLEDLVKETKNLVSDIIEETDSIEKEKKVINYFVQNIVMSAKYCESRKKKIKALGGSK